MMTSNTFRKYRTPEDPLPNYAMFYLDICWNIIPSLDAVNDICQFVFIHLLLTTFYGVCMYACNLIFTAITATDIVGFLFLVVPKGRPPLLRASSTMAGAASPSPSIKSVSFL